MVVYEFAMGRYSGYAPDLPGCVSTGENHQEVRHNMREALETHVSLLVEQGEEISISATHTVHFPMPVEQTDVQHWIVERLEVEVPISKPRSKASTT